MSPAVWHLHGRTLGNPPHDAWEFKKIMDAGILMTIGTDWAVTDDPNLFPALEGMLKHGDNSIDLESAVGALTTNGALAVGRERDFGKIEVGKLATFIILDRNIFEIDSSHISETKVISTIFEGRTVYHSK